MYFLKVITDEQKLTISEVAEQTGLSAYTLRYYERIGLMAPVTKGLRGHRRYDKADLGWITLIQRLRSTDMSVKEMQHFAELVRRGDETVSERRKLLEKHRATLRARLEDIEQTLKLLDHKVTTYRNMEQETDKETR